MNPTPLTRLHELPAKIERAAIELAGIENRIAKLELAVRLLENDAIAEVAWDVELRTPNQREARENEFLFGDSSYKEHLEELTSARFYAAKQSALLERLRHEFTVAQICTNAEARP